MLLTKRRLNKESTPEVANREVIDRLEDHLEEMTILVLFGMANVTHSTQVKRKSNVCNKRERRLKNFDMQQQVLIVFFRDRSLFTGEGGTIFLAPLWRGPFF